MKQIWVVSADWKFRALVRAELRERGYEARGYENLTSAAGEVSPGARLPAALVLDASDADAAIVSEEIGTWARRLPTLVVVSGAQASFRPPAGVHVLRRPVQIDEVVAQVVECAGGSE